ncbi:hypothetical protein VAB18032_29486 [Micromonospora maris AB-18-032]|nr:hypothetical protein VAB18032_29486 [Micromonospora maris AB-18-032]
MDRQTSTLCAIPGPACHHLPVTSTAHPAIEQ